jgi:tetratricopeptide (TPR) repeat protein
VPYLEQVKNSRGERLGAVMMRAGLSYAIPVSRVRDWLQKNRIAFSGHQSHEAPLAKELPASAFLTTAHLLHLMAAVLYQDRDLLDLAIQHYQSVLQLEPERIDVLRNLGLAFAATGQTDRAQMMYKRAFVKSPGDPILLKNMGELRSHMQDLQGAVELYQAAIKQDPCLVSASLGLGEVLHAQGRTEEAKEVLRRVAACPSSSYTAYHVGLAFEQQGLGRDALQIWEDILRQTDTTSVTELTILKQIRQRAAQLRSQLQSQDREFSVGSIPSSGQPLVRNADY